MGWTSCVMGPLTTNDYRHLVDAMKRMEEIALTRSYQGVTVTARTIPAGKPWNVAMLVQVHVWRPGVEWRQNFESVEGARRAIEQA